MDNFIFAYYQGIQDGSIVVGRWIRLWYEYIVRGLESRLFFFDQKKANKAIRFIELFCHHNEGRSDLLVLELWQKAIVSVLFGVVDETGARQFREALLVMMRKQGKTLFASAIIAYMAYLDGEYGAKIYCLAPKLDQAYLVYDNFYQMILQEPELAEQAKKRRSDIYLPEFNTSIKPIAFNAKKSDGFNPHLTIGDEVASWQGDAGLKQYEVMTSATGGRRQPLTLSLSTAGYVNDGIYDELFKRGTAVLLGNSREKRFAPFLYTIDDVDKWNDINELRKAGPNIGVSVSVDFLLEQIAIAEGSLSKKAEFMTKYCNIKQNSSQAWLDFKTVEMACGSELLLDDFRGCYCVGGIDLSKTTDLTACCIIIERAGRLYIITQFFMPESRLTTAQEEDGVPYDIYRKHSWLKISGENHVDYKDCFQWFTDLIEKYEIYPLKIGYDRYCAQYLVQDMKNYGFHMDDVYQGTNLTPVIREFEGSIKDGIIDIGDNKLMQVNLLNAALKIDAETQKVRLVKVATRTRIDGTAAALDAMTVRQKYYAEIGEQLRNITEGA